MMFFWPEILLVYHSMIQRIIDVVHSERVPLKKNSTTVPTVVLEIQEVRFGESHVVKFSRAKL